MRAPDGRTRLAAALAALALLLAAGAFLYPKLRALWHHHRVVQNLDSRDGAVRLRAAIELATSRDARAVPVLVAALEADEGTNALPEDQVAALCAIGGARAAEALGDALNHSGANRSRLTEALACIDDPAARLVLAKALRNEDDEAVRTIVITLSDSNDPEIVDLLIDAEKHADRKQRVALLASLTAPAGSVLAPRLSAVLAVASKDQDSSVRAAAGDSLRWNALNAPGSAGNWIDGTPPAAPLDSSERRLAVAASRASAFIATRQDPAGYWRTSRTATPRFERHFAEMNTYLTPVMVDMLAPVAAAGLDANLAKARRQISGEIEDTGLVRYYGKRPGFLGTDRNCQISLDADDTALAWRVAPRPQPRMLRDALAVLRQYRGQNGLYRTWLAPTDGLQCIDRGRDPNPADIGIQMHILMLLAQASPVDARELCDALSKSIRDDRFWVYYRMEPLIPMLRESDLAKAGCPVQIPRARIRADIAGQGKWLAVGRMLARASQKLAGTRDRAAATRLLLTLAQGDFIAIRRAPPLIYQNDATGKVPGFYWSQELGYALWLRLYDATMRGTG